MEKRLWKVATVKATGARYIVESISDDRVKVMGEVSQRLFRPKKHPRHVTIHRPRKCFFLDRVEISEESNPTNLAGE